MSKTEQALVLEPATELTFKGPFTDIVTAYLKLKNPTEKKILFKVKTTAPKRYCVRPNGGILDPSASISVAVMLQPFEYDPSEKSKHKFMVQSMFAPEGQIESQDQLWKDALPESLMDTKLKCVFDMPDGTPQNASHDSSLEEKVKAVKTEPVSVTLPSKPSAQSGGEDRKLTDEAKRLQSEINVLTAENRRLKDENDQLKKEKVEAREREEQMRTQLRESRHTAEVVDQEAGSVCMKICISSTRSKRAAKGKVNLQ